MTSPQAPVGRLAVCATPIGNLEDVTIRVLDALRAADLVACEDTRHTRALLARHGISARAVSLHEHNERSRASELLERMRSGATVALVCDAGTPLVSDPGFTLVRACVQAGIEVQALPGPSAVLAALVVSGLPCERWRYVGFLPRARGQLGELLAGATDTLVAFESPARLAGTLEQLAAQDPARPVAVCRELTKLHEEVRRGAASELAVHYRQQPARGEVALVVGAAQAGRAPLQGALAAVRELIDAGAKPRSAAAAVAKLTGLRANELYREITKL
ncbi:MAG: 16S rRNA (cytidine(1402)-2'-O)-methyltransferase [Solirubrobacteraceae bacterium]